MEHTSWSYYCLTPKAHLSYIKLQNATLLPHKARKTLSTVCHNTLICWNKKHTYQISVSAHVYENLNAISFFIPCIHRITCTQFSHQQISIKQCMYSLEAQFTDKYHTFPNPWNSTVAKEFNNLFFSNGRFEQKYLWIKSWINRKFICKPVFIFNSVIC
jgi:hypothetical protein